jgi:hypothetical protein
MRKIEVTKKLVPMLTIGCFGLFLAMITTPLTVETAEADKGLEVTRVELAQVIQPTDPEWRAAAARGAVNGARRAWNWAKKWTAVAEQVARSSGLDPLNQAAQNGGVAGLSAVALNTMPAGALD